ncbi:unnamed protein product, partial [Ectocarpus sp. 13 AM-2016]
GGFTFFCGRARWWRFDVHRRQDIGHQHFERAVVLQRDGAGVGGAAGIFRAATAHVRTLLRGRAGGR